MKGSGGQKPRTFCFLCISTWRGATRARPGEGHSVSHVEVIVAAVEDPKTLGRARTSFANEAEIDEFVTTLAKFESGEWTSDQWRAYRLVRGTYGQRQPDVQMLRVKIPQGILDGAQ